MKVTPKSNGLTNKNTKQAVSRFCEQIASQNKEHNIVISSDVLFDEDPATGAKAKTDQRNQKRKTSKGNNHEESKSSTEELLVYLRNAVSA